MDRSTKEAWLTGPGDLREEDVEDVPSPGMSVRVRALPAAFSNEAQSTAMEVKTTPQGDAIATVNTRTMEVLQFVHGVIEPKFSKPEAEIIAQRYASAWRKVIDKIDELSGLDKEAIERASATFPAGGAGEERGDVGDAAPAGSGRPDQPVRVGAAVGDDGG